MRSRPWTVFITSCSTYLHTGSNAQQQHADMGTHDSAEHLQTTNAPPRCTLLTVRMGPFAGFCAPLFRVSLAPFLESKQKFVSVCNLFFSIQFSLTDTVPFHSVLLIAVHLLSSGVILTPEDNNVIKFNKNSIKLLQIYSNHKQHSIEQPL